ncbi:MAG: S8 family peptidase [Anaerolineaceae bacterium]|nr:S8 family peptidase [Anaerolineaceae bacterium]
MQKMNKIISILMLLSLTIVAIGPATIITVGGSIVHPLIAQMAAETPDQMLRVIVQKADTSSQVESLVEQLGGEVISDLYIINAIIAEISAADAIKLGANPAVRWVSLDAAVESTSRSGDKPQPANQVSLPPNYFLETLNVQPVWDMGYHGEGIGVAVIDSGIFTDRDFSITVGKPKIRIVAEVNLNGEKTSDEYGHGTHVAGILGGNGTASDGFYSGIAPKVDLINLKISDDYGMAYESDAVEALQWVLDNKAEYNIRVVNLSINTTTEGSYHNSPLDAAAEILWFNGVVVVVSSGNKGPGGGFNTANAAPANDPFVITVGASDEKGTPDRSDDMVASFSAFGSTTDGFVKPDIIAPGKDIISVLAQSSDWAINAPDRVVVENEYFRISGTSMSAPMVSAAVALLLQSEPDLTPDQVKYRLINSGSVITGNDTYLDIYAAIMGETTESANTGILASQMLWSGDDPIAWESVAWNSVAWNSVAWNSVAWNSVAWNSVAWNSVSWSSVSWN